MLTKLLAATALTLVIVQPASAGQSGGFEENAPGRETAIQACLDLNEYAPAEAIEAVEDGLGDFLVWVEDRDGDLWMCNANADGAVYANVMMEGDLLQGDGPEMIGYTPMVNRERPNFGGGDDGGRSGGASDPASRAEALCAAVAETVEEMQIIATVEDGLGDYLVWLENGEAELWMCNASAEAELYAFEPVDYPINDATGTEQYCTDDDDRVA
jgi:hypothetical protein